MDQAHIQKHLDKIHESAGLPAAMEELFRWSLESGYLTDKKLNGNRRYAWPDPETGVTFRTQINYARHGYTPAPPDKSLHCPICIENVGTPGKENLRVFEFELNGKEFFLQLTPFPLFTHHFVVIRKEKVPMMMNPESMADLLAFLDAAPGYTCCSNSDVEWAGASVLVHHHYQVFKDLSLPVMEAGVYENCRHTGNGIEVSMLNFPIAALRISARKRADFYTACSELVLEWKKMDAGRNTCNVIFTRNEDGYTGHLILRNPDHRTPEDLVHIKSEGVGIIEVAGEGIYPVPAAAKELARIKTHGCDIIKRIIAGNNPVKKGRKKLFRHLISSWSTTSTP